MNNRLTGNMNPVALGLCLALAGLAVAVHSGADANGILMPVLATAGIVAILALIRRQRRRAAKIDPELLRTHTYALRN